MARVFLWSPKPIYHSPPRVLPGCLLHQLPGSAPDGARHPARPRSASKRRRFSCCCVGSPPRVGLTHHVGPQRPLLSAAQLVGPGLASRSGPAWTQAHGYAGHCVLWRIAQANPTKRSRTYGRTGAFGTSVPKATAAHESPSATGSVPGAAEGPSGSPREGYPSCHFISPSPSQNRHFPLPTRASAPSGCSPNTDSLASNSTRFPIITPDTCNPAHLTPSPPIRA